MTQTKLEVPTRITVTKLLAEEFDGYPPSLIDSLVNGLKQPQKFVPCEFQYDDLGSKYFDEMVDSAEYYLPRKERELLHDRGAEIAAFTGPCDIYELGSGSAKKTSILLRYYEAAGHPFVFYPIDINQSIMLQGAHELARMIPSININCLAGTFEQALSWMRPSGQKRLVLYLGSSLSQHDDYELFHKLHATLNTGEHLLLAFDLDKSPDILVSAYQNIEAQRCSSNVLAHLNSRFDGNFDLERFKFCVTYNSSHRRCEAHQRSLIDQEVHLKKLNLTLSISAGESVCTAHMKKLILEDVIRQFDEMGFSKEKIFFDDQSWYAFVLLRRN